jgi:iron complex outermembrane receptor protein
MSSSSKLSRPLARAIAAVLVPIAGVAGAETLEEVVVKGQLIRSEDSSFSAVVLANDTVREQGYADIDELFRLVPGMAVRDLQLGTVANSIVIRGFGGGGHGGDLRCHTPTAMSI